MIKKAIKSIWNGCVVGKIECSFPACDALFLFALLALNEFGVLSATEKRK